MKQSRQQRIELLRQITKGQIPDDLKPWEVWIQSDFDTNLFTCKGVTATKEQLDARMKAMANRRRFIKVVNETPAQPGTLSPDL